MSAKRKQAPSDNPKTTKQFELTPESMQNFIQAHLTSVFMKNIAGELDEITLLKELERNIAAVNAGDMNELEAMLMSQAKTLQTMFSSFAIRATGHKELKPYQTLINMALKAQSQSRATIQALIELKYPRQVILTQQANINHGNQQVNNGVTQPSYSANHSSNDTPARKNQSEPNKLMESYHDHSQTFENQPQRLDRRTAQNPIQSHTPLEAVAAIHRRKDDKGQGKSGSKRI